MATVRWRLRRHRLASPATRLSSIGINTQTHATLTDRVILRARSGDHSAGVDNTQLQIADLPEGPNYVHVASVSGSGIRGTVDHVELKVDKGAPMVNLDGVPPGYANEPVRIEVNAVDALSGMHPIADDDGQPATFIEVDGHVYSTPGDEASVEIATSGTHLVRYWARDLAGNQPDPAQIQTATVKVDLELASLEIALEAKRRVRAGRRVKFIGRVRAANAEIESGKLVEIQVRVGKKWRTVGQAFRTNADGSFTYPYRFRRFYTRPTRFKFRLKVMPELGWPYSEPLYSAKRKVKVIPRRR